MHRRMFAFARACVFMALPFLASAAVAQLTEAAGVSGGEAVVDDRGVSLHVYGEQDGEWREFLRFDCFAEDPHYHYVGWREKTNEMLHLGYTKKLTCALAHIIAAVGQQ